MVGTYCVLCSGCPRVELCRGVWFTMGPAILSFSDNLYAKSVSITEIIDNFILRQFKHFYYFGNNDKHNYSQLHPSYAAAHC